MLESLSIQGHKVTVLTYPEGDTPRIPNCRIVRLRPIPGVKNVKPGPSWKKLLYDILLYFKAHRMMIREDFAIIHAVEEAAYIAQILKKRFGVPYVYDMDSSLTDQVVERYRFLASLRPLLKRFEKALVTESIGVIPVCKILEEMVLQYAPGKLVQRLEDISLIPIDGKLETDGMHHPGDSGPVLMYIGNLERYQGIDLLLESFQILLHRMTQATLLIVGGSTRDIEHYRLRAAMLGIAGRTIFTGPRPLSDLPLFFARADVLVSPRIKGTNTPMKIYSYLDSGKPLLATRLPTHTQVLDPNIALLADADPDAMAKAMLRLIQDKELQKRLARNAKERVKRFNTFETYHRKICSFYNELEGRLSPGDEGTS